MSFIFTNVSGYQATIDRLKSQIAELVDETLPTPIQVFKTESILDYTFGTLSVVKSPTNYPLFLITEGAEDETQNNIPVSDISLDCFMCFNENDSEYGKQVNQIFSKLREIFKTHHSGFFKVSNIVRSNKPDALFATNSDKKPFWSISFTVTAKQQKY